MASSGCWYAVVEWNQAGGHPRLVSDDLHDDITDAQDVAAAERRKAVAVGRGERYTVHEVDQAETLESTR